MYYSICQCFNVRIEQCLNFSVLQSQCFNVRLWLNWIYWLYSSMWQYCLVYFVRNSSVFQWCGNLRLPNVWTSIESVLFLSVTKPCYASFVFKSHLFLLGRPNFNPPPDTPKTLFFLAHCCKSRPCSKSKTFSVDFSFTNRDLAGAILSLLDDDVSTWRSRCTTEDGQSGTRCSFRRVLPTQRVSSPHRCSNCWRSIRYSDEKVIQTILWNYMYVFSKL